MSMMGTGVAAGVAQTGLQSQQVARERDRRANQTAEDARRVRDLFQSHLQAVEEGDETEDPTQVRTDRELPDPSTPQYDPNAYAHDPIAPEPTSDDDVDDRPLAATTDPSHGSSSAALYRHLDVRA